MMLALTDHDTLDGLAEAQEAAEESGLTFLPGVEIDTEFPETLHLLGLDFDPENAKLRETLQAVGDRRKERNEIMLQKLAAFGCDVRPWLEAQEGTMTRLHIARALCTGGYAKDIRMRFAAISPQECLAMRRSDACRPRRRSGSFWMPGACRSSHIRVSSSATCGA